MTREVMDFDVIIIGAGPAGLSAGIRLAQLSQKENKPLSIAVLEKSEEIGGHIVSGAVLETRALFELIPDWEKKNIPYMTPVSDDQFLYLTEKKTWSLPTPSPLRNNGNYVISLSQFCRFLAKEAEALGVNLFPGFNAAELIYTDNVVSGVITGDKGLDKNNQPKAQYQAGMALVAKQVIIAEGCRGSLARSVIARYQLDKNCDPQTYGLGIKEVWEIPHELHHPGRVIHTIGWPLDQRTYGGSFIYHLTDSLVAVGFVIGLDYTNPYLNPYEEFQRFKTHPFLYPLLSKGKRVAYGARSLVEGGLQSIPKLTFPGGVLIGDAAGFLNVAKIKGIHNSMKSGMVAAESIFPLVLNSTTTESPHYQTHLKESWLWQDLYRVRNIRPAFRLGLWPGLVYAALDTYIFRGQAPWTFHHQQPDHAMLKPAIACKKIVYPKHDGIVSFDLMSSVFLTHVQYDENQPCHLKLKDAMTPTTVNLAKFAAPEQRYCPAGVYEILYHADNQPYLQINAANCIHCKACDIKDPQQNIVWTTPEGGSGPQYNLL